MGRKGARALEGHFPRHLRKRAGEKKIKREDGGGGTKFLTFAAGGKVGAGNKLRQRRWYELGGRKRRMVGIEGERGPLVFWRKSPR